jgi:lipoate-protein ligase A
MHTVRLLPFAAASGAENMARDEALLHSAADRGVATLRFYTWTEPTLTLGYFQPAAERLPNIAWVRRSTGGAAIVHDPAHEITYSLTLPPGADWQPAGESWICRMHYVIRDVLNPIGVSAKAVVCGEERKNGPVLCFLHHTPGDLAVEIQGRLAERSGPDFTSPRWGEVADSSNARTAGEGPSTPPTPHPRSATPSLPSPQRGEGESATRHKIVGSAQRKWKGALLQHGSVLLGRSPFAPELPGVAELSGVVVDPKRLAAGVVDRLGAVTGWRIEPGNWTADELRLAGQVMAEKYAAKEWNEKR